MNKTLIKVFEKSLDIMKTDNRCVGGWHFGSIARGLEDELSDVDPVFLIKEDYFEEFADSIPQMFKEICDEVILIWPEEFNSHVIKNFGILFVKNKEILQYDIFLINTAYTNEYMSKIHYAGCTEEDILFDKHGEVKYLLENQEDESIAERDILQLIDKYWFHCNMMIKYYRREDIYKLMKNLQIIFSTHFELLLSKYQKTNWGGWDSLIKHNIPQEKQIELLQYFCSGNLLEINKALYKVTNLFSQDAHRICKDKGFDYPQEIEQNIMNNFRKYVHKI
jgi:predicted nucleotidyltransferase